MKRSYMVAGMVLVALLIVGLPSIQYQARVKVEVTWSVRETKPKDHVVEIAGDSFTIPAGQAVRRNQQYRGGGDAWLLLKKQGWGFFGQKLMVDGEVVSVSQIHRSNDRGKWVFFGVGSSPAMKAEIEL